MKHNQSFHLTQLPELPVIRPDEFPDTFLPSVAQAADSELADIMRKDAMRRHGSSLEDWA